MKNEITQIINGRRVLLILIFLPLIYTLCFMTMFAKNLLTEVPIIVVNLDDGTRGQKILRDLLDTPEVKIISVEDTAADIDKKILELDAIGAAVIPKDFSQKISRGESVSIELITDNTNTLLSSVVSRAVQSVVSANSTEILIDTRISAGWSIQQAESSFFNSSTRVFYNPTSGYTDFFMTMIIPHAVQIAIVFSIAPAIAEERISRRRDFLEKPFKVLGTKLLVYTLFSTSVVAICLSIGIKFFGMVCRGDFFAIVAILTAFIFAMTAVAICAGAWNEVPYKATLCAVVYIMPSILFTGALWPRYSMDSFSLFLSYIMPIGYASNDLRDLFLKGTAINLEGHLAILICFGMIFFTASLIGVKFTGGCEDVGDNPPRNTLSD